MTGKGNETRTAEFLNHTGGTYSHGGMTDYQRFPISELHLGTCPDCMDFQSWKVNFKTEVCTNSVLLQVTMQWIKEVEIAKSIDELMTSRSILERTDFTHNNMLDAMIASALKRLLDKHIRFRKRERVEGQRAQKYDRFLRGRQIACVIYEHFRATGAYEVQGFSDLLSILLQIDEVQDFDVRWDQGLLSASDMSSDGHMTCGSRVRGDSDFHPLVFHLRNFLWTRTVTALHALQ